MANEAKYGPAREEAGAERPRTGCSDLPGSGDAHSRSGRGVARVASLAAALSLVLSLPVHAQPIEGPIEGPVEGPIEGDTGGDEDESNLELDLGDVLEQGDTGITGLVVDGDADNAPLGGVEVTVERDGQRIRRIQTTPEGRYQLRLSPGVYTLKFRLEFFTPFAVEGIEIRPNRIEYQDDLPMQLDTGSLGEAAVTSFEVDLNTEAVQQTQRQQADEVRDNLSAQEIGRRGASDAGSAAKSVVATQIVGGRYLYVRGLGGRYTSVTLNGALLPQLDLDSPGVELDLFPSYMLSNISVVKSYTPDLPGSFGGGALILNTREFPEELEVSASIGVSGNSLTTGQRAPAHRGTSTDFLGFDSGRRRSLRGGVDENVLTFDAFPAGPEFDAAGTSFDDDWEVNNQRVAVLPISSLKLSVGNTFRLRGNRRFGFYVGTGWNLNRTRRDEVIGVGAVDRDDGGEIVGLQQRDRLERNAYTEEARLGAIATGRLYLGDEHSFTAVSLFNQIGERYAAIENGTLEELGNDGNSVRGRLAWTQRTLFFNQFLGQHYLGDARVNYHLYTTLLRRNQPNTRDFAYGPSSGEPRDFGPGPYPSGGLTWFNRGPRDGQRLFSQLDGQDYGGGASVEYDYNKAGEFKFELGTFFSISTREYDFRRFDINLSQPTFDGAVRQTNPELLFDNENFGSTWTIREIFSSVNSFQSRDDLYAVYGSGSLRLHRRLKLLAGLRVEAFRQALDPGTSGLVGEDAILNEEAFVERTIIDYLPTAALTVPLEEQKMNLRAAYSITVARPRSNELSENVRPDFIRNRTIVGDPDVQPARIQNLDLRWEWFPTGREVIAASLFAKLFDSPIEFVILDPNRTVSFQNVDSARNLGIELELKLGLERIHERLRGFLFGTNVTYVNSAALLTEEQQRIATSDERGLQFQAPWVINASLGYDPDNLPFSAYLFYNVTGPFLVEAGNEPFPDTIQQPFHRLDLVVNWDVSDDFSIKASARNLALDTVDRQQEVRGDTVSIRDFDPGVDVSVSVTWRN